MTTATEINEAARELERKNLALPSGPRQTVEPSAITVVVNTHEPLHKHLSRCLDSIMWQLAGADEVLVFADGYQPQVDRCRTKIFSLPKMGIAAARNEGINRAKGAWIKFLDVDDLLTPFALNAFRRVRLRIPPEVAVLAGQQMRIQNGLFIGIGNAPVVEDVIEHQNPLLISQCFVRRDMSSAVGGFDARIEFEEDWDFWLRLREAGYGFWTLAVPVCCYWVDDGERAQKQRNHQVNGQDVREYLRDRYKISPIR